MKDLTASFLASARHRFGFLTEEMGFSEPKLSQQGWQFTELLYLRADAGVRVTLDNEEEALVYLLRLVDGRLPSRDDSSRTVLVDTVAIRESPNWTPPKRAQPFDAENLDVIMREYAAAVRTYSDGFFVGASRGQTGRAAPSQRHV